MQALKHLSQDFPRYAGHIARRTIVPEELVAEIESNQMKAQGGVSMLWLNGLAVPESDVTPLGYVHSIACVLS